jgi:uncharacterized LabA/DUF88 family protein
VIAYIDGFNLYWGLRDAYQRRYLWLNLEKLTLSMLRRDQQLMVVCYFTVRTRDDPAGGARQADYLEALSSCKQVEVHIWRYQEKNMRCHSCGHTWRSYEEETDVAIAVNLVRDAARGSMDTALVVSGDGDLLPAMKAAKEMKPALALVAAFPPRRHSDQIRRFATADFTINETKLRRAQFPQCVAGSTRTVHRPAHWK